MQDRKFKYDVFISYKHAELDMKVASALQQGLERYRIPKEIQKKYGKKKIERVFRDQDELSVGYNLNDEIEEQLKQSEFLVVICSKESQKSIWVQREVATFLKYHPASSILPLLIDGEPEEAFPEKLIAMGEPFAADIRAESHKEVLKKLKTEIFRLIAPVLHCSYDELIQRHKRYQMQRMMIASFVALVIALSFIGSLLKQNKRIQKAYKEQLKTESQFLVKRAEQEEKDGDYLTAIHSLCQALPSHEEDRPLLPEAQYGLTTILDLYKGRSVEFGSNLKMESRGFFEDSYDNGNGTKKIDMIRELFLDESGQYLLGIGSYELLVWDTRSLKVKHIFTTKSSIQNHISRKNVQDSILFFADEYSLYAYDFIKNEVKWKVNDPNSIRTAVYNSSTKKVCYLTKMNLSMVDASNGKMLERKMLKLEEEEDIYGGDVCSMAQDGSYVAIETHSEEAEFLKLYDHNLKELMVLQEKGTIDASYFQNHLLFYKSVFGGQAAIHAIDLTKHKEIWQTTLKTGKTGTCTFLRNEKENLIYCCTNSVLYVMDAKTGSLLYNMDIDSDPISYAFDEDWFSLVLSSGKYYIISYEGQLLSKEQIFPRKINIIRMDSQNNCYYVYEPEGHIVKYEYEKMDSNYHTIVDIGNETVDADSFGYYDQGIFWIDSEKVSLFYSDGKNKLQSIDLNNHLTSSDVSSGHIHLDSVEGHKISYLTSSYDIQKRIVIDLDKGSVEKPLQLEESYNADLQDVLKENQYLSVYNEDGFVEITLQNVISKEKSTFSLSIKGQRQQVYADTFLPSILREDAKKAFFYDEDSLYLYYIDLKQQELIRKIDLSFMTRQELSDFNYNSLNRWVRWSKDGKFFAISSKDQINLYNEKGEMIQSISLEQREDALNVMEACCYFSLDGSHLYYMDYGSLCQYDIILGKECNRILVDQKLQSASCEMEIEDQRLLLKNYNGIYLIQIKEDAFGMIGLVPDAISYDSQTRRFYVPSLTKERQQCIGYFEEYDLQDILVIAEKKMKGEEP